MTHDIDLECISISSFKDEMAPTTTKAAHRGSRSRSWEADQEEEPPIFRYTACNISKTTKLSWYNIYEEFVNKDIPETQEDFQVYINIKKSRLDKVTTHPLGFPCSKTIEWIFHCTDTNSWMIRGHDRAPIANISLADISAYYRLPERQELFNTRWLAKFGTPMKVILREWWQDLSKFRVKIDQAYRTEGLHKVYQLIFAVMFWLYGKANYDVFYGTWVPLMYVVATCCGQQQPPFLFSVIPKTK